MSKQKSLFQERLVSLYLRLNGYIQSGFIPHSDTWGNAGTDIDRIGLRFPLHSQPERMVNCSPELKIPKEAIDIIIAEVKSNSVSFNGTLKKTENGAVENWQQILSWLGLFEKEEVSHLVPKLIEITSLNGNNATKEFNQLAHSNRFGNITIRPILFVIDQEYNTSSPKKWINGNTIIDFIWECFCPEIRREGCSTVYPLNLWGTEYEDIVVYFKNRHKMKKGKGTLADIYSTLISE